MADVAPLELPEPVAGAGFLKRSCQTIDAKVRWHTRRKRPADHRPY